MWVRGRESLETVCGFAPGDSDHTERSLKTKRPPERERSRQIPNGSPSFCRLSYHPLFVSSSTLCSEQGSLGHSAGCEAWGWISIRALLSLCRRTEGEDGAHHSPQNEIPAARPVRAHPAEAREQITKRVRWRETRGRRVETDGGKWWCEAERWFGKVEVRRRWKGGITAERPPLAPSPAMLTFKSLAYQLITWHRPMFSTLFSYLFMILLWLQTQLQCFCRLPLNIPSHSSFLISGCLPVECLFVSMLSCCVCVCAGHSSAWQR